MNDYELRYRAILDYSTDGEECNACSALDDICPFHVGVAVGVDWVAAHLARIAEDPERLNLMAERMVRR